MHKRGYVHRDIKPENIVFKSTTSLHVLVIDFSITRPFSRHELMLTPCGTLDYTAPEILAVRDDVPNGGRKGYSSCVDNWSIGVVTYVLLCGYPPFFSPSENRFEIKRQILAGYYRFHEPYWKKVSNDAKDFISSFLQVKPNYRMTLPLASKHRWLSPSKVSTDDIYPHMINSLRQTIGHKQWRLFGLCASVLNRLIMFSPILVERLTQRMT